MKGIEVTGPGKWHFRDDLPVPEPGPDEVRIKVKAAGICGTDVHIINGDPSLVSIMNFPVVLGHEFCGHVDLPGTNVKNLRVGQYVSAEMHCVCRQCRACAEFDFHACEKTIIQGIHKNGSFAEYVVVPAWNVQTLPEQIPVKVGAVMDALGNAVHTVSKHKVKDRSVALVGYGPIGAMAAEVAIHQGARELFIIDVAEKALSRAQAWIERKGLSDKVAVLNSREPELAERLIKLTNGGVDVSLDFSGAEAGINLALQVSRFGGKVALLGMPKVQRVTIENYSRDIIWKGLQVNGIIGREMFATWDTMKEMLTSNLDISWLVSAEYPLEKFAEAIESFSSGREQKVVLVP